MKKSMILFALIILFLFTFCPSTLLTARADDTTINVGSVSGDGTGYTYSGGVITIRTNGSYVITGTSTSNTIVVASGVTANITLNTVNIAISSGGNPAFDMKGATVNLTLVGDNVLQSFYGPGLRSSQGSLTITQTSTGTLTAKGGDYGAGIGGGYYEDCGAILINGGILQANGGSSGTGIGCGPQGIGGSITIDGGEVHAQGGSSAVGMGATTGTTDVTIISGTVVASGGEDGAGISGGSSLDSYGVINVGSVHIQGGNVTATGGQSGAGIGGSYTGFGEIGNITIDGGTVNATGGNYGGAGIGGGAYSGKKGFIRINGGNITATGRFSSAGIGGGGGLPGDDDCSSYSGDITITGGTVTAYGGLYAAAIGSGGGSTISECDTITITGADTVVNANGDYGLDDDHDIGSGHYFSSDYTVIRGGTLKVDGGATVNMNQNGSNSSKQYTTCVIGGTGAGSEAGIYYYGQKVNGVIDLTNPGIGKLSGTGYTVADSTVAISSNGTYAVTGTTQTNRIKVMSGVTANVTMRDASIDVSAISGACAFNMDGATVNLTLVGEGNTLHSGSGCAGLQVPTGSMLTVSGQSTAKLDVTGGANGAGIGGGDTESGGDITVSGGEVTATGGVNGAGIGGGNGGSCGTVSILSQVGASGGANGAGIGGGNNGGGGIVYVTGGSGIMAWAMGGTSFDGYDVGSGYGNTSGGSLTVNGGITFGLMRNGTNASASYITCGIGGQGAGLSMGTYLNSQKQLSVKSFVTDHSDGANAFDTVQMAVLIDGLSDTLPEGEIVFESDGIEIGRSSISHNSELEDSQGFAMLSWTAQGGNHTLTAQYVQNETADSYYMTDIGQIADYEVAKISQVPLTIGGVPETVTYGDMPFALTVGGGSGDGAVSYSINSGDAVSVDSSGTVTVEKAGTAEITVTKAGDSNYLPASATLDVTVNKAVPPTVVFPYAGMLTYGQSLSDSALTGGSGDGIFAWESQDTVPTVLNGGYNVVFTPNDTDNYDYSGFTLTQTVSIQVNKAIPAETFPTAAEITYEQHLSDSTLTGGSGDGTFAWENPDTVPTVVNSGYHVIFTPSDTDNYQEVSQSISIHVLKAGQVPLSIGGVPESVTYGDAPFALTVGGGSGDGAVSYSITSGDAVSVDSNGNVTVEKAGTAEITVTKAGDSNYLPVSATLDVTVNKATPPTVIFPYSGMLTYGQRLSDSALTGGSGDGTFAWESPDTVPTVLNDGYSMVFTPNDTYNYDYSGVTLAQTVSIQVNKAIPAVTFPTAAEITYEQHLSDSTLTGGSGDGTFAWENPDTVPTVVNSGYNVIFTPSDTDNYQEVSQNVSIHVLKAGQMSLTIGGVPETVTYGDAPFTLTVGGGSGEGAVSYSITSGDAVSVDSSGTVTVEKAGMAEITVTKAGDSNYLPASAILDVTVNKAALATVVFPYSGMLTYGQHLSDSALTGGSGDGTFAWENPDTVPTVVNGGYNVVFTPSDTDNYQEVSQNISIHVLKAEQVPLTIGGVPESVTYGNAPFALTVTGSGDGAVSYSINSGDAVSVDSSGTVTVEKAGTAEITVTKAGDSNYLPASAILDLTVNKAAPPTMVFPCAGTLTYGQHLSDSALTGGSGDGSFTWENSDTVPTVVNGGYNVVFTPTDTDNYDYSGFTLTQAVSVQVNKAIPAVTFPTTAEITYGQHLSDSTLTGGSGDGTFAWENPDTVPTVINSGYNVVFTPNDTDNYDYSGFTLTQAVSLQVNKAIPTETFPAAAEIIYGQHLSDSALTGGSGDGTFAWVSPDTVPTVVNSGYNMVFTPSDTDNYEEVSQSILIHVLKAEQAPLTIVGIPETVTYGDVPFALTANGGSGEGAVSYSLTSGDAVSVDSNGTVTVKKAGTAEITVTKAGDGNYDPVTTTVVIHVAKAATSIPTLPTTDEITVIGSLSSLVLKGGAGSVDGTFAWTNPDTVISSAGEYEVTFTPADTENYLSCTGDVRVEISRILTDSSSAVTLDLSGTTLPSGVTSVSLGSSETATGSAAYQALFSLIRSDASLGDLNNLVLYDLKLLDQNGDAIENFSGEIKVKLKIPAGMSGNLHVLWYNPDGTSFTDMNATQEDGYLVFETTHFSYYAVAQFSAVSSADNPLNPETGSKGWPFIAFAFLSGGSAVGIVIVKRRKFCRRKKSLL